MSNNIVVKSTLPRTASTEEKLNEITNQLQQKYQGETIYYMWEIKKQNKEVNFETLAKWRYKGWPQKCCKTGATFDYKKYYWIATELKGSKWGLIKTDKR